MAQQPSQPQIDPALLARLMQPIKRPGVIAPDLARRMYARLHGIGTPLSLLDRARRYLATDGMPEPLAIVFPLASMPAPQANSQPAMPASIPNRPIVRQIIERVVERSLPIAPIDQPASASKSHEVRLVAKGRIADTSKIMDLFDTTNVSPTPVLPTVAAAPIQLIPIVLPTVAAAPILPTPVLPTVAIAPVLLAATAEPELASSAAIQAATPIPPTYREPNTVLPPVRRVRHNAEEPHGSAVIEQVLPARMRESSTPDLRATAPILAHPQSEIIIDAYERSGGPLPLVAPTRHQEITTALPTIPSVKPVLAPQIATTPEMLPLVIARVPEPLPLVAPTRHQEITTALPTVPSVKPVLASQPMPVLPTVPTVKPVLAPQIATAPEMLPLVIARVPEPPQPAMPLMVQPAPTSAPASTMPLIIHSVPGPAQPAVMQETSIARLDLVRPLIAGGAQNMAIPAHADTPHAPMAALPPLPLPPAAPAPIPTRPIDVDRIAEKVLRKLMRELDVEGERKGWRR